MLRLKSNTSAPFPLYYIFIFVWTIHAGAVTSDVVTGGPLERGGAAAVRCGGGLTAAHLAAHVSICRGEGGEGRTAPH